MLNVLKICIIFIAIYHSYQKEWKIKNTISLHAICMIKKNVVHIRLLKQALNHGLIFKKVHRVIRLNQEAWLKPYIEVNIKFKTEAKNDFKKDFFKLMNNSFFGKTMKNVRKHRDIKLVTTDKRGNN